MYIKILLGFLYNWVADSHIYFVAETTMTDNCFTPGSKLPFPFIIPSHQNHLYASRPSTKAYIVFIRYNTTT